jgi:hypothetical protein
MEKKRRYFIFSRPAFSNRQFQFKRASHSASAAADQGFVVDALGRGDSCVGQFITPAAAVDAYQTL